jgi:ketosteroid isomerase-like protein
MEARAPKSGRNVEIVNAIYANLASDPKAMHGLVAPNALILGFPGGTNRQGPEGLLSTFAELRPVFRSFALEPVAVSVADERVLVHLRVGGVGQSGAELWRDTFHVHTVRDDRCVRIEAFESRAEAERAAGLDGGA